jgi:hypothetical protein
MKKAKVLTSFFLFTQNKLYQQGQEVEMEDNLFEDYSDIGFVELVEDVEVKVKVKAETKPKTTRKKTTKSEG